MGWEMEDQGMGKGELSEGEKSVVSEMRSVVLFRLSKTPCEDRAWLLPGIDVQWTLAPECEVAALRGLLLAWDPIGMWPAGIIIKQLL